MTNAMPTGSPPFKSPRQATQATAPPLPPSLPTARTWPSWSILAAVLVVSVLAGAALVLSLGSGSIPSGDLAVGQCASDVVFDGSRVTDVLAVDCRQPHDLEVFSLATIDGGPDWPGEDVVRDRGQSHCRAAAGSFLQEPLADSPWTVRLLHPSPQTWAAGDRVVTCMLADANGAQTIGPVSGR